MLVPGSFTSVVRTRELGSAGPAEHDTGSGLGRTRGRLRPVHTSGPRWRLGKRPGLPHLQSHGRLGPEASAWRMNSLRPATYAHSRHYAHRRTAASASWQHTLHSTRRRVVSRTRQQCTPRPAQAGPGCGLPDDDHRVQPVTAQLRACVGRQNGQRHSVISGASWPSRRV